MRIGTALIAGAALSFVYLQGLYGGFFFDDVPNIVQATALHISTLDIDNILIAAESGHAGPLGRPISLITFALNYYTCGLDPYCFKLGNLILHIFNTFLVGGLIFLLARERYNKICTPTLWVLLVLTALWALHPIQVTSVLYVVQRMTSLSSFFVLIGLVFHIYARQCEIKRIKLLFMMFSWFLAFPLALLCKETGLLLVVYVFCYEFFLFPAHNNKWDQFGRYYVVLVSTAIVIGLCFVLVQPGWITDGYASRPFTLAERLITESRVLWSYVQMLFVPSLPSFGLYHDDFVVSKGVLAPKSGLVAILGWVIAIALIWLQREGRPMLSFAFAWFLVGHSLESTIIPLEIMHEHRNYLPSLVIPFLGLYLYAESVMSFRGARVAVVAGIIAFSTYLAVLTYLRSDMYGDDFRRTQVEVQYHPRSVRSNYDAGALLVNMYNAHPNQELVPLAQSFFSKANALDDNFKLGLVAQMQLDCMVNGVVSPTRIDELARRLGDGIVAVQERSTMGGVVAAMANRTLCLNNIDLARLFDSFLGNPMANNYDKAKILNLYGHYIWTQEANASGALELFEKAIHYNGRDFSNYFNKIQLLRWLGDREGVLKVIPSVESMKMNREESKLWLRLRQDLIADRVLNG